MTARPRVRCRRPRIAVVGGGPGGLFTAWHLERFAHLPLSVTIFEASDRLGGKVWSPRFDTPLCGDPAGGLRGHPAGGLRGDSAGGLRGDPAGGLRYEAGAAEFYDYSGVGDDPLRELVASLGLPTMSMGGTTVVVDGRMIANLDDVGMHLGGAARGAIVDFDARCRGLLTRREVYASGLDRPPAMPPGRFAALLDRIDDAAARRYVETLVHSDLATEPAATSVEYGLHNYLMNDPAVLRLYRIVGGNERLVEELAARLTATVRLGTQVTEVAGHDGGLRVAWRADRADGVRGEAGGGAGGGADEFDVVILALPIEPLRRITFADGPLAAAMRRHLAHHDHPAHYLRITALVDRPRGGGCGGAAAGDDAFLMLDAFGGCCLYVDSPGGPGGDRLILGWLLAGAAAEALAGLPDDDLAARALATLPESMAGLRHGLLETRVHRWVGAVSGLPGGTTLLPVDRRHRPAAATHPGVFLVGDYLFDSTLNGVLDSAEHVAGWVAAELASGPGWSEGVA